MRQFRQRSLDEAKRYLEEGLGMVFPTASAYRRKSESKSLAVEWSKHGVLTSAIAPRVFRTAPNVQVPDGTARGKEFLLRTPISRFSELEELVGAAVFLASDAASFVTGQILAVDGGFLLAA
jgi:NAD(P)-dependent dehydrogenase (short-subunit alcohol dehydrogenase family)